MTSIHARALLAGSLLLAAALTACRSTDSLAASTDAWHAERIQKLSAPDGWLSLVGLEWLEEGDNRMGRGPEADVAYAGLPADHVGTFVVDEDGVWFETVDGVAVEGVPADGDLRTDADGSPTVLAIGDVRFHVVVRGGRLGVRIKDAAAPTRAEFGGVERYPVDDAWRITAEFLPAAEGDTIDLDTVIGVTAEAPISGRARFELAGAQVDAVLLASSNGGSMLRFGDASNGGETYTIGRYLYVEPSPDGATVVLDFNRAYNPPCAFTPFATCSLAPTSNVLPFPVTAGERWSLDG